MYTDIQNKFDGKMGEVLRFAIVGVAATLIQYGVYFVLVLWLNPTLAMTIAYAVSFAFNFVATTLLLMHAPHALCERAM